MRKPDRFRAVVEKFKSMRNYLKYFGVDEEDHTGQNGTLVFDFGLVLENQFAFYSGLIFKVVVSNIVESEFNITGQAGGEGYNNQKAAKATPLL